MLSYLEKNDHKTDACDSTDQSEPLQSIPASLEKEEKWKTPGLLQHKDPYLIIICSTENNIACCGMPFNKTNSPGMTQKLLPGISYILG